VPIVDISVSFLLKRPPLRGLDDAAHGSRGLIGLGARRARGITRDFSARGFSSKKQRCENPKNQRLRKILGIRPSRS
jgi:hypothetical protein